MGERGTTQAMRRVVITGIGAVTSIGIGRENFFDALGAGVSGVGGITAFDASAFPVRIAGEVKEFDHHSIAGRYPAVCGINDRKVAFGLAAFDEACESANISPAMLADARTALNLGVSLEVFSVDEIASCVVDSALDFSKLLAEVKGSRHRMQVPLDTTNTILVQRHRMPGANFVNCSACAASAQAIGHSFRMIRRNDIDRAFCGGMDSMINPLGVGGFGLLGALSTSNELGPGACRPFDARRNGTVLGEGAGVLVLEEMHSAINRNARIIAEVVGYGSSLDAYKPTDPDPDGTGAALAMRAALAAARIRPEQIGYINAHGTSTPKNDEIETRAIKSVFGEHAASMPVSSTKSMVGHCIAAAGAIECIASLSAFERDLLPPTINYSTKDFYCDLDYVPNNARPWKGEYIMTNSFGFGGQNAVLILKRWADDHG